MSLSDPLHRASLMGRVQGILLRPSSEWDKIDVEPATTQGMFTGYAMILAAIGPVCHAIGVMVFGMGVPGIVTYRPNIIFVLLTAVVTYVLSLVAVFVLGFIIDALAPTFGGVKNQNQAMKAAVYSSTAAWVGGVFQIIPLLGIVGLLFGLYSLYLLFLGLPKMMKTTSDKALGYTALAVVCYIVLSIVIGLVTAPIMMMGAAASTAGMGVVGDSGTVHVGANSINLAALAAAGKQAEAQAKVMEAAQASGGTVTVGSGATAAAPDALKALLPTSVNGFARGETSAESTGVGGMNTAHASADYAKGDATMKLEVTDTGGMAAITGMAAAMGVNSSKETATGYEKISTAGGRMVSEEYDRSAKTGKYSVMSGRGVVEASGSNVSMDDLKAAVSSVDPTRVASLAH